jgi:hypothetical protein
MDNLLYESDLGDLLIKGTNGIYTHISNKKRNTKI